MEEKSLLELVNGALDMLTEIKKRLEIEQQEEAAKKETAAAETTKDDWKPVDLSDVVPQPSPAPQPVSDSAPEQATAQAPQPMPGSAPQQATAPTISPSPTPTPAQQQVPSQQAAPTQSSTASKSGIRLEFGGFSQTISTGGTASSQTAGSGAINAANDNQPAISAARRPGPVPAPASQPVNEAQSTFSQRSPGLSPEERAKAYTMPEAPTPSGFRFCGNCGNPVKTTAKFCKHCGERL